MADTAHKVRENRLRRMADRQGLRVEKARRMDPRAIDYGTYALVDPEQGTVIAGPRLSIDELEAALLSGEQARAGDVSPAGWAPADAVRLLREGYNPEHVVRLTGGISL